ncbi:pentapeptide repeat-containing protein [Micromonospora oryzae]
MTQLPRGRTEPCHPRPRQLRHRGPRRCLRRHLRRADLRRADLRRADLHRADRR